MHELAARCSRIAAANGFDSPTWDNLPIKAVLVITELDEAVQAVQGVGADPLGEELADAAIRILSLLEGVWGADWNVRPLPYRDSVDLLNRIEVLAWRPLGRVCGAIEAWRADHRADARGHLEYALREVHSLAAILNVDLHAEIEAKCTKNEGRAKLHGKARSEA